MSVSPWAFALALAIALTPVARAQARHILITNDDGLTSNVKDLHDALKARGHDVLVVVPCQQQSGMGGALHAMKPLGPLSADCLNGAARAGDPGAGPVRRPDLGPDYHYVDGTPVMATLYGIDVVAAARWGKAPDLVISGPNIGRNVGGIVVSSGTVSNAQYALMRGIPAIALSAGMGTHSGPDLVNAESKLVAQRVLELVMQLETTAGEKDLLPAGTALNVNFPDNPTGSKWKLARIGTSIPYDVRFVSDLQAASQANTPPRPALLFQALPNQQVSKAGEDEAFVSRSAISVSVMQFAYDAPAKSQLRALRRFKRILAQ